MLERGHYRPNIGIDPRLLECQYQGFMFIFYLTANQNVEVGNSPSMRYPTFSQHMPSKILFFCLSSENMKKSYLFIAILTKVPLCIQEGI